MKKIIQIVILASLVVPAIAQTPPAVALYYLNGASWSPDPNGTGSNAYPSTPPPVGIYCSTDGKTWTPCTIGGSGGGVTSFNTRTGAVVPANGDYTVSQVTGAAPLASPTFTGLVTLPNTSLSGAAPSMLYTDTNGNNQGSICPFLDSFNLSLNRNCATGTFFNTAKTGAILAMNSTGSGTTSYMQFYTGSVVNTVPTEHMRLAAGLSIGSGNVGTDPGNGIVLATSYTSNVTTGTAPLTVASTTQVNNLNASLLGGVALSGLCQTGGSGCSFTSGFTSILGVTPVDQQVPAIAYSTHLTAQTGAITTTNTVASATAGDYMVCAKMKITTAGTAGTFQYTLGFNNGSAQTIVGSTLLTTTNNAYTNTACQEVDVTGSTALTYAVAAAGVTGTPQYRLDVQWMRMN